MTKTQTYRIIRFYQDDRDTEIVVRGLTLDQAQAHCRREDTHGEGWFDGYEADCPLRGREMSDKVNMFPVRDIPGRWGYALIALMDDGGTLCESCLRDPSNPVHDAQTVDRWHDGWGVVGFMFMSPGDCEDLIVCNHCGRVLVEVDADEYDQEER